VQQKFYKRLETKGQPFFVRRTNKLNRPNLTLQPWAFLVQMNYTQLTHWIFGFFGWAGHIFGFTGILRHV
jgi:hypothetical protein